MAALFLTLPAHAESSMGLNGGSASARVLIQVQVAPVVRVLQDLHPATLTAQAGAQVRAEQVLTLSSNIRQGFCLRLHNQHAPGMPWQLSSTVSDDVTVHAQAEGYLLCVRRHGVFSLVLQHEFEASGEPSGPATRPWPLLTEVVAI